MPDYTRVGLVTFGTHVHVHELGFEACPKSYVFQGSKEYTQQVSKPHAAQCGSSLLPNTVPLMGPTPSSSRCSKKYAAGKVAGGELALLC